MAQGFGSRGRGRRLGHKSPHTSSNKGAVIARTQRWGCAGSALEPGPSRMEKSPIPLPWAAPDRPLQPEQLPGVFPVGFSPFSRGIRALEQRWVRDPLRGGMRGPWVIPWEGAGISLPGIHPWSLGMLPPGGSCARPRPCRHPREGQKLGTAKWELNPASSGHQKQPADSLGLSPLPALPREQEPAAGRGFGDPREGKKCI